MPVGNRRMINPQVTESGSFLKMPLSTQALYFHLCTHSDDDGVVEAYTVTRMIGSAENEIGLLILKKFVTVLDSEEEIVWLNHWYDHNHIRSDTLIPSKYRELLVSVVPGITLRESTRKDAHQARTERNHKNKLLSVTENERKTHGSVTNPGTRIGEDRIGENRKEITTTVVDEEPKELQISSKVRVLWDAWEREMTPITKNHGFMRNALSRLLKLHGEELVLQMIRVASMVHVEPYTPSKLKVSNPKQLEDQWEPLMLWAKSKATDQIVNRRSPEEEAFFRA